MQEIFGGENEKKCFILIELMSGIAAFVFSIPAPGNSRKKNGFTLIELMIVIAIIAILASILVPNFGKARDKAKLETCKSNLKSIATALEMYAGDHNGCYQPSSYMRFDETHPVISSGYLKAVPKCPAAVIDSTYNYWVDSYDSTHRTFLVFCVGNLGGHASMGLANNYPRYDSARGLLVK